MRAKGCKVSMVCEVDGCRKAYSTRGRFVRHLMRVHGQGAAEAMDAAVAMFEDAEGAVRGAPCASDMGTSPALPEGIAEMFRAMLEEEDRVIRQSAELLREVIGLLERHHVATKDLRLAYIEVRAKLQELEKERAEAAGTAAA